MTRQRIDRKSATVGKRTAKPDRTLRGRGGGKAVAQLTSKTRTANEAPCALARGGTDFRRTADQAITGHRRSTDGKMQAKRDAQQAKSQGRSR